MNLKTYQEEFKRIVFFQEKEVKKSDLWGGEIPARMHAYRNNSRSNWTDTLNCNYPLTRAQFSSEDWESLIKKFFIKFPPAHWELNNSVAPFVEFLQKQKLPLYIKELADYEWHDLKIFIDRAEVKPSCGLTNPTATLRVYQHQIFDWVESGAAHQNPPQLKPEVLVFFRDSQNTCRILEADPLMILIMEEYRKKTANLAELENLRAQILPNNHVNLQDALAKLAKQDLILL